MGDTQNIETNKSTCDSFFFLKKHRAAGEFKPKKITVDEAKTYFLCGCKYTHNEQGFCDGTHRKEEGIKKYNEFLLKANSKLKDEIAQAQRKQKVANVVAGLSIAFVLVSAAIKYRLYK